MKPYVILTGTDPASRKGGIGFALPGYMAALERHGVPYFSVPSYHPASRCGKWLPWVLAFPRLFRAIRSARNSGFRPTVYSHAGAGVSLLREAFILAAARAMGAATIEQIHAPEVDGYLDRPVARLLFKLCVWPAHRIGALTPWWSRRLAAAGIRQPISVIPNPLAPEWEAAAQGALSVDRNTPAGADGDAGDDADDDASLSVLTITRLVAGKGVDVAIEAMTHLPPQVRLKVAGEGREKERLLRIVERSQLGHRVSFLGWVSAEEKAKLWAEADIFCLPSVNDSFGMGYLEAMAHGVPVVAVAWGPIPDVVADGEAGILVEKPDARAVARAIEQLADPSVRRRMGAAARRWVLDRFSAARVGAAIAEALPK